MANANIDLQKDPLPPHGLHEVRILDAVLHDDRGIEKLRGLGAHIVLFFEIAKGPYVGLKYATPLPADLCSTCRHAECERGRARWRMALEALGLEGHIVGDGHTVISPELLRGATGMLAVNRADPQSVHTFFVSPPFVSHVREVLREALS